jgi:hypothetical protein
MKPVMEWVYWCFPQCVEAFKHCRPVISVDGTFLTGKYRGVLLIATGVDGEDRLAPLAFALAESENIDSWSWFFSFGPSGRCGTSQEGVHSFRPPSKNTKCG